MDFFESQRTQMVNKFGMQTLQHPHPGVIGRGLTPQQALASINPAFQDPSAFAHITRDYNTPITIHEEPLTSDMEIDT